MSELLLFLFGLMVGIIVTERILHFDSLRRDERIAQELHDLYEQSAKDLQNHRDTIIGKEGNEA